VSRLEWVWAACAWLLLAVQAWSVVYTVVVLRRSREWRRRSDREWHDMFGPPPEDDTGRPAAEWARFDAWDEASRGPRFTPFACGFVRGVSSALDEDFHLSGFRL
jgi:hypothetical protein